MGLGKILAVLMVFAIIPLAGCGDDDSGNKDAGGTGTTGGTGGTVANYGWTTVGTAGFNGAMASELALRGHAGQVYLAYTDSSSGTMQGTLVRWTGAAWSDVATGPFHTGPHQKTVLRFNNAGRPVLAYLVPNPPAGATGTINTRGMDGNDWDSPVQFITLVVNARIAMEWDASANVPVIGAVDTDAGETVFQRPGGVRLLEDALAKEVAARYVSADEYYMAMIDNTGRARIIRNGQNDSVEFSEGEASSLCLDAVDGNFWAAFIDKDAAGEVSVVKNPGTAGAACLGARGFTSGTGNLGGLSLIAVAEDEIYIGYQRSEGSKNVFHVEKWDGSAWTSLGQANDPAINSAFYPVMAFVNNSLYVAFNECVMDMGSYVSGGVTVRKWAIQ